MMQRVCGPRRAAVRRRAGVALAGALLLLLATAATVAAEPPSAERPVGLSPAKGHDAVGLRLGLLCFVGLALAGGAYAQYQSFAAIRRCGPAARAPQRPPATGAPHRPAPQAAVAMADDARLPGVRAGLAAPPAPPVPLRAVAPSAPRRSPAEEHCARAIAAARRYDRRTTLAAFGSALACDPGVKPSALPGFWELPSGGHADLARAYLERGQYLDARSVLTFAAMLFPHNRELEALAREADRGGRIGRSA